jgi:hypothetical protein
MDMDKKVFLAENTLLLELFRSKEDLGMLQEISDKINKYAEREPLFKGYEVHKRKPTKKGLRMTIIDLEEENPIPKGSVDKICNKIENIVKSYNVNVTVIFHTYMSGININVKTDKKYSFEKIVR